MTRLPFAALLPLLCLAAAPAPSPALPDDAAAALAHPSEVQLFSLEPWAMPGGDTERMHDRSVLGSAYLSGGEGASATAAVGQAIAGWDGIDPGCSDPRYALRVHGTDAAVYDFLVSYQCHEVQVYKGDQLLGRFGAFGDSRALDDLLTGHQIPVSRSGQMRGG